MVDFQMEIEAKLQKRVKKDAYYKFQAWEKAKGKQDEKKSRAYLRVDLSGTKITPSLATGQGKLLTRGIILLLPMLDLMR